MSCMPISCSDKAKVITDEPRMIIQFCPQCGTKVEATFIFCASCGVKLPKQEEEDDVSSTAAQATAVPENTEKGGKQLRRKKGSPQKKELPDSSPVKKVTRGMQKVEETITSDSSKVAASAELVKKGKPNLRKKGSPQKKDLPDSSPCVEPSSPKRKVEENVACDTSRIAALGKSPQGKRARRSAVEPLPENEILTDINAKSWQLLKLVANDENGVLYEARGTSGATAKEQYLLKLDTKEGRIFNEQNFFLRAVKPKTVQMWQKSHGVNFLGIPPCIGFGLHAEKYRFLVFPDYGNSLQSFLDASKKLLSEKAVFQITYRLISVLEYIHDNEYVHGDIKAENLFATTTDLTKIYLTGYGHAFRYYPSGKHVEYREGSRTLHEGTVEFTSLDSHKGVGPSCRSDLESLGYCMVKWLTGSLPWSSMLEKPKDVTALKQKCKEDPTSFLKQCFGKKKIPDALITYFQHVASLRYEEKPNYEQLKTTLQNALKKLKTTVDDPVDL